MLVPWRQGLASRRELERIQYAQSQPCVTAEVVPRDDGLLLFRVGNVGPTSAHNIKIHFDPTPGSSDHKLGERLELLASRGISGLAPGRFQTYALDSSLGDREKSGLPLEFCVTVEAEDKDGPLDPLTYRIDLEDLRGVLIDQSLEGHSKQGPICPRPKGARQKVSDEQMLQKVREIHRNLGGDDVASRIDG